MNFIRNISQLCSMLFIASSISLFADTPIKNGFQIWPFEWVGAEQTDEEINDKKVEQLRKDIGWEGDVDTLKTLEALKSPEERSENFNTSF
jgi:hypothetical protein